MMKKLFNGVGLGGGVGGWGHNSPRKKSEDEDASTTLDRLVRDKDGLRRRLEEEEREFNIRKKEFVANLVNLEKQEVERREKELEKKKEELKEKKRLNKQVVDKFEEQMKLLEKKLAEVKEEQNRTESGIEGEISEIQEKLNAVRMSLNEKLESMDEPTAPSSDSSHSHPSSPPLYPDLLGLSRSSSGYVGRDMHGSTGSSPQISLASTISTSSTRVDSD